MRRITDEEAVIKGSELNEATKLADKLHEVLSESDLDEVLQSCAIGFLIYTKSLNWEHHPDDVLDIIFRASKEALKNHLERKDE